VSFQNLDGLPELTDLNLANNKLVAVGDGLQFNQKLATLNIAQNPFTIFEVRKIRRSKGVAFKNQRRGKNVRATHYL